MVFSIFQPSFRNICTMPELKNHSTGAATKYFCLMTFSEYIWLAVSSRLKNMSQNGNLPQVGVKIKAYLKPPPRYDNDVWCFQNLDSNRFSKFVDEAQIMEYFNLCTWIISLTPLLTLFPPIRPITGGVAESTAHKPTNFRWKLQSESVACHPVMETCQVSEAASYAQYSKIDMDLVRNNSNNH